MRFLLTIMLARRSISNTALGISVRFDLFRYIHGNNIFLIEMLSAVKKPVCLFLNDSH